MLKSYRHTKTACYFGYITQAIVNNFAPMLFLIFRERFSISLEQVTMLITVNFGVQLIVDFLSAKLVDKIGYRVCVVAAHLLAAAGLAGLALLPSVMPAFAGLLVAVVLYAVGGGLIEVVISPIVEACPSEHKSAQMSLLHSFYCWGTALVVVVTTLFLTFLGGDGWKIAAYVWAAVPVANAVYFSFVPVPRLTEEGEGLKMRELFKSGIFWLFVFLMLFAGASELAMSQWASAFAERGLGVSKTVGDLAGPCLFAVCMGCARVIGAKFAEKHLVAWLTFSAALCAVAYLLASLSPLPWLALAGCGLCGFSVGAMWPGVYSMASQKIPKGGTTLFALLALAGDAGCSFGPTLVGLAAAALGDELQTGLLFSLIFPVCFLILLSLFKIKRKPRL